jgi:immunity protein 5 of polymorphic toxin system
MADVAGGVHQSGSHEPREAPHARWWETCESHPGRVTHARTRASTLTTMDTRSEIREFLTSRRARLKVADVGLPDFGFRPVPGLRREEVAVLAGVSVPWENLSVSSPQTLSEADRRVVAGWAADCAERVLGVFEAEAPEDSRPRDAIARTRAFARGELEVAAEIRRRFVAHGAAREVSAPAAAAAWAAGQAASMPHMGAHALGAAAYAAKVAGLVAPDRPEAVSEEIRWQLDQLSAAATAALRQLPAVGEHSSGPLGPGLLASGLLGAIIRDLQAGLADPGHARPPRS